MGEPSGDLGRPRIAWLPYETVTTRVVWSIPAVAFILFWKYWLIAAEAVPFYPPISQAEIAALVVRELPQTLVPLGQTQYPLLHHLLPWIAAAGWALYLVRWRTPAPGAGFALLSLIAPVLVVIANPPIAILGAIECFILPFVPLDGEGLEMVSRGFPALWVLFMLAVLSATAGARRTAETCESCGYSLAGLRGTTCPECGSDRSRTLM